MPQNGLIVDLHTELCARLLHAEKDSVLMRILHDADGLPTSMRTVGVQRG